jgi:hypothetical protein
MGEETMESSPSHKATDSIRWRLERAIAGDIVTHPVFVVYDWFVRNRPVDWEKLFRLGLGQINHADLIQYHRPHADIVETRQMIEGQLRRDVRWITDVGELHEWYLGEWRQEYLIKSPEDYRIMMRAWMDTEVVATDAFFDASERELGSRGITIGQMDRTPFQKIQIDYAGLERFSYDIADRNPYLLELLDLMNALKLEEFKRVRQSRACHLKLWENLSIETMGPHMYREYLVPVYRQIFQILNGSGKRLQVHYDGKLSIIAKDIQELPFDGLDSLTPPPEGDMTISQARAWWPDKFFWLHPSLTWYRLPPGELVNRIRTMVRDAGPTRYCLMVSEEVPPNWEVTLPLVLETLDSLTF